MKMNVFGVILLILNVESGKYKFINQQKTWYNADQYCRQTFGTQLAIIRNAHDNNLAKQVCQGHECWFGANDRSREHKFKFSNGESVSYTNWAPHEPNNLGNEDCVEIRGNGQWNDNDCHYKRPFICDAGSPRPTKAYVKGPHAMTYLDAYAYCRGTHAANLAVITSAQDNEDANTICGNGNCWIGFNDLGNEGHWRWLDGSHVTYTNWHPHEPNNFGIEHCGHLYSHYKTWNDNDCYKKFIPLCNPKNSEAARMVHYAQSDGFADNLETKNELVNTIESKIENDMHDEPIINGIYFDNNNVTKLVLVVLSVTLGLIFIVFGLNAFIKHIQSSNKRHKLYELIRQTTESEESATDAI